MNEQETIPAEAPTDTPEVTETEVETSEPEEVEDMDTSARPVCINQFGGPIRDTFLVQ